MTFRDGTWKFFIDGGSEITAKCAVTFRSLGSTRLSGLVKIVGANRPYAFHLFANVLPTEIQINKASSRTLLCIGSFCGWDCFGYAR